MTKEELLEFIGDDKKMRMSHIYQPLLIKLLVEAGGISTVRQLAIEFLTEDEPYVKYYEDIIKRYPHQTLSKKGIISSDEKKRVFTLSTDVSKLSPADRAEITLACEQRIREYIQKREDLWEYKTPASGKISNAKRYLLLTLAKQRCVLCGIKSDKRPLDIDHIIPRSKGGTDDISNLQVLCAKCNRSKGNRDNTDFRHKPDTAMKGCNACSIPKKEIVYELDTTYAKRVADKASKYHVIPKRHVDVITDLSHKEWSQLYDTIQALSKRRAEELGTTSVAPKSIKLQAQKKYEHFRLEVEW